MKIEKPMEIEKESFRIITEELSQMGRSIPEEYENVVKRVIHTTADFSYLDSLYFSKDVMKQAKKALLGGARIITDTNMAKSGIHAASLKRLHSEVLCYMADEQIAAEAKQRQVTRAQVSMEHTALMNEQFIYVIGNAPTALARIVELSQEQKLSPLLVIGAPVGFVNVVEAKELLIASQLPCIVTRGRKGGSNVAAAIINAILYEITER